MYDVLGDSEAQDSIRQSNKNCNHCALLKKSPDACESLPKDFDDVKQGEICPHNPFYKSEVIDGLREVEDNSHILSEAYFIYDLVCLNKLPDIDQLSMEEFQTARIMQEYNRAKEMNIDQAMTLSTLAKAFGGGK